MKGLIKFFSSIKLAIILITIITIASIFGTLIPQNRPPQEYIQHYGQLASVFQKLHLTQLYSSWWYLTLLTIFTLNLLVCTLLRLGPKIRRAFSPKIGQEKKRILSLQVNETVKKSISPEKIPEIIKKIFRKYHYRIKIQSTEKHLYLLGRKKMLGLFGVDFVHLGLLIIVIGGIISGFTSFRTHLNIREKEVVPVPQANFSLRLDKFEMEYYPNGSIKDWKSTLTIIDNQTEKITKTIEVNHPLAYQGFRFYQSSYGWDWKHPQFIIEIKKRSDPGYSHQLTLIPRQPQEAPDDLSLVITHFVPDFIITENRQVATRSLEPRNPAAFIQVKQGDEQIYSGWIFAKFPEFSRSHTASSSDYHFIFKDLKAGMYSGIQVAKDPGTNFIWAGCVFLGIGLFLAFYWPPREIWGLVEISGHQVDVHFGGVARKNKDSFAEEFTRLISDFRSFK
jgi:cytochrome c biogenesis protein